MIYFDNNSTTKVDDAVIAAMLPYFSDHYGNYSSSNHKYGWIANSAVEKARDIIASFIGSKSHEIIFTSGATESINTAIHSIISVYGKKRKRIVVVTTEHKAVLEVVELYGKENFEIISIGVDREGMVDLTELSSVFDETVLMVCIMLANNETGVIHPVEIIADIAKHHGIIVFCDATQCIGKLPVNVESLKVDLMCFSAHKFHGPKGVGAIYIRSRNPRVVFEPFIIGGGQENGFRSGTLNVSGIVGMGKAAEIAGEGLWDNMSYLSRIRNHFEHQLLDYDVTINGTTRYRLCNTSNICFNNIDSKFVITQLKDVAISMGSACTSQSVSPSHVLEAMGLSNSEISSSLRFSFGRFNTELEVEKVLNMLKPLLTH